MKKISVIVLSFFAIALVSCDKDHDVAGKKVTLNLTIPTVSTRTTLSDELETSKIIKQVWAEGDKIFVIPNDVSKSDLTLDYVESHSYAISEGVGTNQAVLSIDEDVMSNALMYMYLVPSENSDGLVVVDYSEQDGSLENLYKYSALMAYPDGVTSSGGKHELTFHQYSTTIIKLIPQWPEGVWSLKKLYIESENLYNRVDILVDTDAGCSTKGTIKVGVSGSYDGGPLYIAIPSGFEGDLPSSSNDLFPHSLKGFILTAQSAEMTYVEKEITSDIAISPGSVAVLKKSFR